jgi:hypothetical protein
MRYTGFVRGNTIEIDERLPFPEGQAVSVSVQPMTGEPAHGSPQAILRGICQPPHVRAEDVDELERAIEGARLPVRDGTPFDDVG